MGYLNVKYVMLLEAMNFVIYTQILIENITLSRAFIPVASVNGGTEHIKRYENVLLNSL